MKAIIHLADELVKLRLVSILGYVADALVLKVEIVIAFPLVGGG